MRDHVLIREEKEQDRSAVHAVNAAAFETSAEADLVDALREQARPVVSLVAADNDAVVGHILFSPIAFRGIRISRSWGLRRRRWRRSISAKV